MRLARVSFAVLALALLAAPGQAVNLLTNGEFEPSGGEVPSWTLLEYVSGSGDAINSAELPTSTTAQSPDRHLFVRAFVGGEMPGPNNLTNVELNQSVPVTPGEEYTFSGYSRFEFNFSGGVDTLSANSPLGAVASPTTTELMLEFLDATNNVIGSPVTLDVKADRIAQVGFPDPNDNSYYQHVVTAMAPTGATQARVTAAAYDMVWNVGPTQSMFYDTFSVTSSNDPGTELLMNPTLDEMPANGLEDWTVVTNDPGNPANVEVIRTAAFANHTPGGTRGVWFSSFFGEAGTEVDGTFSQTVAGQAGGDYTLSGWSRWEANFAGGQEGTPTEVLMELAFLDASGSVIGSPVQLDIKADRELQIGGAANDNLWYQHTIDATAPAGTVDVRVSGIMIDGINSMTNPQSAFFDDFVLELAGAGTPGDFDGDNDVDGDDFLAWQRGESPNGATPGDLAEWNANYGTGAAAPTASAIPEPATIVGFVVGLAAMVVQRRRNAAAA